MLRSLKKAIAFGILSGTLAAQHKVVELKEFEPDQIYTSRFSVSQSANVIIDAVGVMSKATKWYKKNPMIAYGWILDADSRKVVWSMNPSNVTEDWASPNVKFSGTISLKPGNYEAYYSTYGQRIVRITSSEKSYLNEFLKNLVKVFVEDHDLYEGMEEWKLNLVCKDSDSPLFTVGESTQSPGVFVSLTRARDNDYLEKGFSLEKEMKVRVYCEGEGMDDRMYDFGWINDDRTLKPVWDMRYENTTHAGGAEKNRMYVGIISLPAGDYVATYVTDDSHSSDDWNMQPPFDPYFWGLTLSVVDKNDMSYVHEYKKAKRQELVALNRMGDSQYRSQAFKLSKTTDIQIYALGEGRDHQMYDYGWITDENTGNRIWEMKYYETKFGGGDEKNRLYEGVITLNAGTYRVHFVTDGSHSFEDWNASPPYNQSRWGITLGLINNDDARNFSRYEEKEDKSVLAQIARVGDDEYRRTRFTLNKDAKVRVICVGEGKYGRMFDYGWIKNIQTGQTVWELTYNMTQHAGGGRKNRIFDGTILLEAGQYEVLYISDGSHSFEDWNDDPPAEPEKWGITIRSIK